jgi:sorbitol-specific phosphotransferase system component IIC
LEVRVLSPASPMEVRPAARAMTTSIGSFLSDKREPAAAAHVGCGVSRIRNFLARVNGFDVFVVYGRTNPWTDVEAPLPKPRSHG